jgi:general secretion pathway protein E
MIVCQSKGSDVASVLKEATLEPSVGVPQRWWAALMAHRRQRSIAIPAFDPTAGSAVSYADQLQIAPELQCRAAAEVLGVEFLESLAQRHVLPRFVQLYPIAFARRHEIVVVQRAGGELQLVMASLRTWQQLDVARRLLDSSIEPAFAPAGEIQRAINLAYQQQSGQVQNLIESLDAETVDAAARLSSAEDLLDVANRPPVIKLVNLMLFEAVQAGASDIHVQPFETRVAVRLRIDGVLFDSFDIPKDMQEEVISRIKILGKMNIAEKRLPQDGRATVQVADRLIDLRVASLPSSHGERIVIRLLDKSARLYTLTELGMDAATLALFRDVIHLEHGLVLVTGPTGSGKSTTLYAALQEINTKDFNVVTLEDPIEYQLDGISQTQINVKKGMTFATGLRNVLRQDPDIIMVGEIRDQETAVMAIQSALTGHLVFSTLHTNDAASAVTRMLDLGIEPYLLSSSLLSVMAQRLVRRICSACAVERPVSPDDRKLLAESEATRALAALRGGDGCESCRQSGYRGRVGIFELLIVNDAIRQQIQSRSNATAIRDQAVASGMRILRDDGLAKIASGATTPEEVQRVTVRATM